MIFDATVAGRTFRVEVRAQDGRYSVSVDGSSLDLEIAGSDPHFASLLVGRESHEVGVERRPEGYTVLLPGETLLVELAEAARGAAPSVRRSHGPSRLNAPMPGRVVRVLAAVGDEVAPGAGVVVLEAMKMENEVRTPGGGRVLEMPVREGQAVEAGALLAVVG